MTGWRPALRLAARDALRSKGRSLLVLVMIALPVLAVTAADIVIQTQDLSGTEALERRVGSAEALVMFQDGAGKVVQAPDPDVGSGWTSSDGNAPTVEAVSTALGREVRAVERREGSVRARTTKGTTSVVAVELDLRNELTDGLYRLVSGRLPSKVGEVVVNPLLAERGPGLGDDLEVVDGESLVIVGIVEDAKYKEPAIAVGMPGAFGVEAGDSRTWLVGSDAPVTWKDVRALNDIGALVVSRHVLENPPPASQLRGGFGSEDSGPDDAILAVVALIVVMALIEVVLLAGPAFAVGARRQARNLALIGASGGTPPQLRRVVLASGVVLGAVAAFLGVLLGIGVAVVAVPVVQAYSTTWFGPFDVPWLHLLSIAVFGLVSALGAAVVPAWIASRQDIVAVLAGRRGDTKASVRSPLLGLALLGAGVAVAVYGATRAATMGEMWIAFSAILAVLGMILLTPVVLVAVSRLSRALPLSLRYAVRDAARHRTRTVPAVAAVAATVAGVVALGIGAASDEAQSREGYTASMAMGDGLVSYTPYGEASDEAFTRTWPEITAAVEREFPGRTTELEGVLFHLPGGGYAMLDIASPDGSPALMDYGGSLSTSHLVAERLPNLELGIAADQIDEANEMLASGGVVALASREMSATESRARLEVWEDPEADTPTRLDEVTLPTRFVKVSGLAPVQAILSPAAAARLGLPVRPAGLVLHGPVSSEQQKDLGEAVNVIAEEASVYVERGYQADDEYVIVLMVLGGLGAVLMLGGTLTATFLALSDARPDLATLSAVGAAPRTRRGVAAAYALVVGLVGALLGAAVGFIPGVAVTWPLTSETWDAGAASHYLDIPWLLIGTLVAGLPLLTAAIVGLAARSRLPLVARLD